MTIPLYRLVGRFTRLATLMCLGTALFGPGLLHLSAAQAAGISINRGDDAVGTGDGCTLREAIINANQDNQSGSTDCGAGSGTDTLTFAGNYTITLASALPNLTSNLTINGAGRSIVLSGNNAVRLFTILNSGVVTLSHLSIISGSADVGGGIINSGGTLTVVNSALRGNSASPSAGGGIYSSGTLSVTNSVFSDNFATAGGGIYNSGTLTVSNSIFSNNWGSPSGGGINNFGTLTVTSSTFDDNLANNGGGLRNEGAATVSNSTFSDNLAYNNGGGIYIYIGTLTIINSTLSDNSAPNGGGIYNQSTLHLGNNIIANSPAGGDCTNTGTLATNQNNWVEDGSCSPAYTGDPGLGPLLFNGGMTPIRPLLPGSPAIDAGDNTLCAAMPVNNVDQRGVIRPIDGNDDGLDVCDLGSVEVSEVLYLPLVRKR